MGMNNNINQVNQPAQPAYPYQAQQAPSNMPAPQVPIQQAPVIYNVPNQPIYTAQNTDNGAISSLLKNYIMANGKQPSNVAEVQAVNMQNTSDGTWKII